MDPLPAMAIGFLVGFIFAAILMNSEEDFVYVKSSIEGWHYVEYQDIYYKLQPIEITGIPVEKEEE